MQSKRRKARAELEGVKRRNAFTKEPLPTISSQNPACYTGIHTLGLKAVTYSVRRGQGWGGVGVG